MAAITHQEVLKTFPFRPGIGARSFVGKIAIVGGAQPMWKRHWLGLLAQEGANVVVHYNSASKQAQAGEVVAAVRGHGWEALIFQAGLTKPLQAMVLSDAAIAKFGEVGIFINTDGKIIRKLQVELEEAEFDELFNVNVNAKAAFFLLKEASKKISDEGCILSFVATMVSAFTPTHPGYVGSWAGVGSRSIALPLAYWISYFSTRPNPTRALIGSSQGRSMTVWATSPTSPASRCFWSRRKRTRVSRRT